MKKLSLDNFFKITTVCLFTIIVPQVCAETETDYMAVFLQGQKVGHSVHSRAVENGNVVTTESFSMTLGRGGQAITVTSQETHIETPEGKPLGFEMTMTTSGIEQKTTGTIKDGKITISRAAMGTTQEETKDWPQGALLSEGLRLLQVKHGLTPGHSFEAKIFRPDMLMSIQAKLQVEEKTTINLLGRPLELTKVKTTMAVQGQQLEMLSYVNDDMKAMKTLVPMMGMELEMVACDKSIALADDNIVDFLEKLSIASPVKLLNLPSIESIAYTLKPTHGKPLNLPVSSSQHVEQSEAGIVVTVTNPKPAENIPFPYKGDDPEILNALKPTDYLQCDNEKVIELAKRAVGTTKDAAVAAYQIEAFVDGYITQKDLSVGYASAAEVVQNRQGDCSEHAVLTAAMCRAVGIPARIVCGVVYADFLMGQQGVFGGHAWTEVYLDGKWYGLDATRSKQHGFGPGHIALTYGNGDPADFLGLTNTLGCFKIEKITLTKKQQENKEAATE